MADEKVLLEALASADFKVSIKEKNQINVLEYQAAEETKQQCGEDTTHTTEDDEKYMDAKSLAGIFKKLSASQRENVIVLLKQNGLGDPLTKEKLVQNSFTVEKTIRDVAF